MRRFRFRLERVLEAGRRRERLLQMELAATMAALSEREGARANTLARRAALGQELPLGAECSVVDLLSVDRERSALKRHAEGLEREIEWLKSIASEQRAALVAAGRRVMLLSRLRERALGEHRRLRSRTEAKRVDDHTVARRMARDRMGGEHSCA
jgi:flagellar export protein FliJ